MEIIGSILDFCLEHWVLSLIAIAVIIRIIFYFAQPKGNCKECGEGTRRTDGENVHLCENCSWQLLEKEELRQNEVLKNAEAKVSCPHDGHEMMKEFIFPDKPEKIVIDRCPHCKSIFLDSGELEKIKEEVKRSSSSGGGGFSSGLVMGMAIG